MNKKQKTVKIFALCVICFVCGVILGLTIHGNKELSDDNKELFDDNKNVLIEYGELLPIDELEAIKEGDNTDALYNVFLYVDPYCDSCIEKILTIERMREIFKTSKVNINVIWKQEPANELNDYMCLPDENQYIANGVNILNEYPIFFITDKKNEIIMVTDDVMKVMKKIFELDGIDKNEIINDSNQYLQSLIPEMDADKNCLIYFAMDGCPDCKNIEVILEKHDILEGYNSLVIYTKDSYGEEEFVDYGSLFLSIYDITWYPSFLIIEEGNCTFIGQESDEKLLNTLLSRMK